jgi:hypothetical protein
MKTISASEFDERFDNGEDVSEYLDFSKAVRPNEQHKRINVDFPLWMLEALDNASSRVGVTRQALIKMWLADKLSAPHS